MDQQVTIRRIRIAATVFFGTLTVTLLLLWVRSSDRVDVLYGNVPGLGGFEIDSREGSLYLMPGPNNRPWGIGSNSTEDWRRRIEVLRQFNIQNGGAGQGIQQIVSVRHGLLAVVAGLMFALLQIKHQLRFSAPHDAHRHDAGGRRAGAGHMAGFIAFPFATLSSGGINR